MAVEQLVVLFTIQVKIMQLIDYKVTWTYMTHEVSAHNLFEAVAIAIELYGDKNNIIKVKKL